MLWPPFRTWATLRCSHFHRYNAFFIFFIFLDKPGCFFSAWCSVSQNDRMGTHSIWEPFQPQCTLGPGRGLQGVLVWCLVIPPSLINIARYGAWESAILVGSPGDLTCTRETTLLSIVLHAALRLTGSVRFLHPVTPTLSICPWWSCSQHTQAVEQDGTACVGHHCLAVWSQTTRFYSRASPSSSPGGGTVMVPTSRGCCEATMCWYTESMWNAAWHVARTQYLLATRKWRNAIETI